MVFFFWSLCLSLILTVVLTVLLLYALRVNRERKNQHGISFLLPVLLTGVFLAVTLFTTIPRLLDTVNILTQTYSIEEIDVPMEGLAWNRVITKKQDYYFNQWQIELTPGERYRVEFTPRSRYITKATRVEVQAEPMHAYGITAAETTTVGTES